MAAHESHSDANHVSVVGREREAAALTSFLETAVRDGGAQLVTGQPGIGKTELLNAAMRQAGSMGARVLRASGSEYETELGFAGLHQLLLPAAGSLPELPEVHRAALATALGFERGDPPGRLMLTSALLAWLAHLASTTPLVLVVDDLQWVDRSSVAVLSLVARRLGGLRVGLLLSQRTGHESFFGRESAPELTLMPLGDDAAVSLLRHHHPNLHSSVQHRILAEADGNPLALIELPRALTAAQETGADFLPSTLPLSARLRWLFESRVSGLPEPTRRLLLLAALGGEDGTMKVIVGSAGDLAPAEASELVFVDRRPDRLRFAHPLIRSAVVDLATAPERRAAHHRLAQLTADPDVQALHLSESALGPDDTIANRLVEAALTTLERGDTVQAVSLLLRAADLTLYPAERARRLARASYIGANIAGTLDGARALLDRARAAHPAVTNTLQASTAAAAHLLNSEGDIDTAHKLLVGAITHTEPDPHSAEALEEALGTLMMICTFGGRQDLWGPFDDAVARLAPLLTAPFRLAAATFTDPVRSTPEQLCELDALVADLDGESNPVRVVMVAVAGHYVDRFPRDALERTAAEGRAGGAVALAVQALIMLAASAFHEGRWQDAGALADAGIALCEENGYNLLMWGAQNPRMLLAAARADLEYIVRARAIVDQWAIPRNALAVRTFTANVEGLAALTQARYQDAYEHYTSICPLGTFPPHEQVMVWTVMDAVEAAVRSGHVKEAHAHVHAAAEANLARIAPRLRFLCDASAALVADDDVYPNLFDPLVADPGSVRWPFPLARLELAYGERLRRDRAMRAARPHLERAGKLFTSLGATPWAERAEATLRATGRSRRQGAAGPGAALTPRERQIAHLAATGLTNRQIGEQMLLSPRTVGAHLYRVFPKLGISSRAALRDALTDLGDEEDGP
ncbi:AAA family ATPase [Streptomyces sp. IB201691-2A2]|uniref:AAA family ATPase n=1 Tax=Streptomyces sp. IB201691-2A2 TaxID=2561920 RepID=UPI00163DD63A|nr:LuxR family transcriptional regulator [Streptomyces sp. IB201691-2A2]